MAHELKLLVRDSVRDTKYLVVSDLSQYDPNLSVTNQALYVQLPGFEDALAVPFVQGGINSYSSHQLIANCPPDQLLALPDGLYTLTLSVAPNSRVFTVAYHFRTAVLEQQVLSRIGQMENCPDVHDVDDCGNVLLDKEERILLRALLLLEGIKANLCDHGDIAAASNTYYEIQKMLKYTC